jgi:hypothetical protein
MDALPSRRVTSAFGPLISTLTALFSALEETDVPKNRNKITNSICFLWFIRSPPVISTASGLRLAGFPPFFLKLTAQKRVLQL